MPEQDAAVKAEAVRDLKGRLEGLTTEHLPEVVFQHVRTGHGLVTVYAVESGEPITIPEYMVVQVIEKRLPDGRYMFVADKKDAPEYKLGDIKCFLHLESPDRVILKKAGLSGKTCLSAHLANPYSKRIHAQHRHKQEWAAYGDFVNSVSAAEERDERRQQLDATLEIARAARPSAPARQAPAPDSTPAATAGGAENSCPDCTWAPKSDTKRPDLALASHRREIHQPAKVAVN